jgi:spore germination protein KC
MWKFRIKGNKDSAGGYRLGTNIFSRLLKKRAAKKPGAVMGEGQGQGLSGGELSVTVRIDVETSIQETQCMEELERPEVIKRYEEALAGAVRGEVEAALVKTQREYHSDVFGFGEAIHRRYPGQWKELQPDWSEVYSGLPVYVVVDAKISRTGLITKPVRYHR